jgi:hypothetical protein
LKLALNHELLSKSAHILNICPRTQGAHKTMGYSRDVEMARGELSAAVVAAYPVRRCRLTPSNLC